MANKEPLDLSKLTKRDFPYKNKLDRDQEDMVNKLYKKGRVVVDSRTGSGKTTVATQAMKALLDKGHINGIYYVVFPVQEESLGYLPGDVSDKIKEYARPFIEALVRAGVNPQGLDIDRICDEDFEGDYNVVAHTYLRGRTLENKGVIVDEIQNGKPKEIKKTLTRLEDDCYILMAGHNGQIDIDVNDSGFSKLKHHFKRGIESDTFTDVDFANLSVNHRGYFSSWVDEMPD